MPDSAWTKVASALLRAEEAVRLDGAGDYKAALVCYKDAIMHLDSEARRRMRGRAALVTHA